MHFLPRQIIDHFGWFQYPKSLTIEIVSWLIDDVDVVGCEDLADAVCEVEDVVVVEEGQIVD